jgi:hypothetical protein
LLAGFRTDRLAREGINNGEISYSVREAAAIGLSAPTASRMFAVLIERGFLKCTKAAAFHVKNREARLWALTAYKIGDERPTKDFMTWAPKEKHSSTNETVKARTVSSAEPSATKLPRTVSPEETDRHP